MNYLMHEKCYFDIKSVVVAVVIKGNITSVAIKWQFDGNQPIS